MICRVEITPAAEVEAQAILDWLIDQQAGEAGLRWFLNLEKAIQSLSHFPERCSLAPENGRFPFEARQLLYGRRPHVYRILFRIEQDVVYVLHIRHGRRLLLR
jgi:plasmid stabilization system protein ParE